MSRSAREPRERVRPPPKHGGRARIPVHEELGDFRRNPAPVDTQDRPTIGIPDVVVLEDPRQWVLGKDPGFQVRVAFEAGGRWIFGHGADRTRRRCGQGNSQPRRRHSRWRGWVSGEGRQGVIVRKSGCSCAQHECAGDQRDHRCGLYRRIPLTCQSGAPRRLGLSLIVRRAGVEHIAGVPRDDDDLRTGEHHRLGVEVADPAVGYGGGPHHIDVGLPGCDLLPVEHLPYSSVSAMAR